MAPAAFENIELTFEGATARLTLNRPDKLNPLDWTTVRELRAGVAAIEANPETHFVVVTGAGDAFSAGGDMAGYLKLYAHPPEFAAFLEDFYKLLTAIEASRNIYIAAVNGVCVAGGLELLLACDLAIAADTARIGDGHLRFGQLPGAGGSQRLPRAIGLMRAKQLMLTGDLISAQECERIGLVSGVAPADGLDQAVSALIAKLGDKSRVGLTSVKHLANLALDTDLKAGLKYEMDFVHRYATTEPDASEGLVAFRDKRKPRFSNGKGAG